MLGLISVLKIICNLLKFRTMHSRYASFICLLNYLMDLLIDEKNRPFCTIENHQMAHECHTNENVMSS